MAKRRRSGGGERFISLPHYMLKSAAWRAFSPNGKAVVIHIWERHNGSNNGQIVYSVREALEIGLKRSPAARALAEALEFGFLKITVMSGFRIKTKEARCWALTAEPIAGEAATRDFMRWVGPKFSPKPHRKGRSKFITQSPQGDAQSPQGDSGTQNETKLPLSVPPGGLKGSKSAAAQSPQGDTSNIPCGVGPRGRRPLRFGDIAKSERTARVPLPAQGEEAPPNPIANPASSTAPPSADERAIKRYWLMRRALAEANRRMLLSDYFRLEDELHADGNYEGYLARGTGALPKSLREFFEQLFPIVQNAAPLVDGGGAQQGWMPLPISGGAAPPEAPSDYSPSMQRCAAALERAKGRGT